MTRNHVETHIPGFTHQCPHCSKTRKSSSYTPLHFLSTFPFLIHSSTLPLYLSVPHTLLLFLSIFPFLIHSSTLPFLIHSSTLPFYLSVPHTLLYTSFLPFLSSYTPLHFLPTCTPFYSYSPLHSVLIFLS